MLCRLKWTLRVETVFQYPHLYKHWRARDDNSPSKQQQQAQVHGHPSCTLWDLWYNPFPQTSTGSSGLLVCTANSMKTVIMLLLSFSFLTTFTRPWACLVSYAQNMHMWTHSRTYRSHLFCSFSTNRLVLNSPWFLFFSRDNSLNRGKIYI